MNTISWIVLLVTLAVLFGFGYLRYGDSWRIMWRRRKLGADDVYMYGTATFITCSDTEELPF